MFSSEPPEPPVAAGTFPESRHDCREMLTADSQRIQNCTLPERKPGLSLPLFSIPGTWKALRQCVLGELLRTYVREGSIATKTVVQRRIVNPSILYAQLPGQCLVHSRPAHSRIR